MRATANTMILIVVTAAAFAASPLHAQPAAIRSSEPVQSLSKGSAQAFPLKPVRMLSGAFGSPSDILARTLGPRLSELWGQPVVIADGFVRMAHATPAG